MKYKKGMKIKFKDFTKGKQTGIIVSFLGDGWFTVKWDNHEIESFVLIKDIIDIIN